MRSSAGKRAKNFWSRDEDQTRKDRRQGNPARPIQSARINTTRSLSYLPGAGADWLSMAARASRPKTLAMFIMAVRQRRSSGSNCLTSSSPLSECIPRRLHLPQSDADQGLNISRLNLTWQPGIFSGDNAIDPVLGRIKMSTAILDQCLDQFLKVFVISYVAIESATASAYWQACSKSALSPGNNKT